MSPGSYCRQLGGSIFAQGSSLQYQENRSPVRLTCPELVVCRLERLTRSWKARGLSHLQLFFCSQVLSNICPIYERKAAHHSRKGELLRLRCGHISSNCGKWRVVTGSRKMISCKRSHRISSLMPETLYIRMSPQMCFEMIPCIRSQSNDNRRFIADVGIVAPTFPFPLLLPFGAIVES